LHEALLFIMLIFGHFFIRALGNFPKGQHHISYIYYIYPKFLQKAKKKTPENEFALIEKDITI